MGALDVVVVVAGAAVLVDIRSTWIARSVVNAPMTLFLLLLLPPLPLPLLLLTLNAI